MGCPIFESSKEITEIIEILLEERADMFGDLKKYFWAGMAACGLREDKDAPKTQKWTLKIEGVTGSKVLLHPDAKYIIWGYKSMWDRCSMEKKIAHVANMLIRIEYPTPDLLQKLADKGDDYEWGKTRKPDVQEFRSFITAPGFGVDWADEATMVPSLIADKTIIVSVTHE